jgi:hypothetical protein
VSRGDCYCCRRAVCVGVVAAFEELIGGIGAATPAVRDPSPNCCKVFASSLPLGFSPCPAWNFFIASPVAVSHLPFGVPANEPSLLSACCISETRSAVGAFCPRSLRLELFRDLPFRVDVPAFAGEVFFGAVAAPCARVADTLSPVTTSIHRAKLIVFLICSLLARFPVLESYCLLSADTTPDRNRVKTRSPSWRRNTLNTTLSPAFSFPTAFR